VKTINLTRGFVTIVDDEDHEALARFRWYASGKPPYIYAQRDERRDGLRRAIMMHRVIASAPPRLVVDHLNGDGLDNRRANLRVCSQSHNIGNARPDRRNNKTGFKGVSWRPDKRKYAAQIAVRRKTRHLGFFDTAEDASAAYQRASREAFYAPNSCTPPRLPKVRNGAG
jgi:hypothetical protein